MNSKQLIRTTLSAACALLFSALAAAQSLPLALPLHTSGHDILDSDGHKVRLTSVNWYGFDQKEFVVGALDHAPLSTIVQQIVDLGVNCGCRGRMRRWSATRRCRIMP
jgi:hypothetical protein